MASVLRQFVIVLLISALVFTLAMNYVLQPALVYNVTFGNYTDINQINETVSRITVASEEVTNSTNDASAFNQIASGTLGAMKMIMGMFELAMIGINQMAVVFGVSRIVVIVAIGILSIVLLFGLISIFYRIP